MEHPVVCKAHWLRMDSHERVSERPVYRLGTWYPSQLVTIYYERTGYKTALCSLCVKAKCAQKNGGNGNGSYCRY